MPESAARVGPGRVLALTYGFLTVAAGARSIVQLATRPEPALFAYCLSAFAACVYAVGTALVIQADHGRHRRLAVVACCAEIVGVIAVGALSLAIPRWFPDATVWSQFGQGYGNVPAILPVLALWWQSKTGPAQTEPT
ncbi:MAG: hypothetical protein ABIR57_04200 [Aeromicrobium sp.]